jgi:hypothetical protein
MAILLTTGEGVARLFAGTGTTRDGADWGWANRDRPAPRATAFAAVASTAGGLRWCDNTCARQRIVAAMRAEHDSSSGKESRRRPAGGPVGVSPAE